jgi:hypothetical protein
MTERGAWRSGTLFGRGMWGKVVPAGSCFPAAYASSVRAYNPGNFIHANII